MLRSGASWTREYDEVEDFVARPSPLGSSSLPHPPAPSSSSHPSASSASSHPSASSASSHPSASAAAPSSSSPFASDEAYPPSSPQAKGRAQGQRDQELPLLPNREPSPGPPTPTTTTSGSGYHHQHQQGRVFQDENAHIRLSPPTSFHQHQHQQHQHQHHVTTASAMSSNAHHESSHQHQQQQVHPRPSMSSAKSPLNPSTSPTPHVARPGSRGSLSALSSPAPGGSSQITQVPISHVPGGSQFAQNQGQGQGSQANQPQGGAFSRMANEELRALSGPYPNSLTSGLPPSGGSRGSMILYRRADSFVGSPLNAGQQQSHGMAPEEGGRYSAYLSHGFGGPGGHGQEGSGASGGFLPPPPIGQSNRGSMYSVSGDSIVSMGMGDGKYPPSLFAPGTPTHSGFAPVHLPSHVGGGAGGGAGGANGATGAGGQIRTTGSGLRGPFQGLEGRTGSVFSDARTSVAFSLNGYGGGMVAYAYDPDEEDLSEDDEDDWLHDPEVAYPKASHARVYASSKSGPAVPPKGATGIQHSNSVSGSSAGGHSDAVLKGKASSMGVASSIRKGGPVGEDGGMGSARTSADGTTTAGGTGEKDKRGLRIPHPSKVPPHYRGTASWSWRGVVNITTLIALLAALLALFMVYPMIRDKMDAGVNARITGNTRINATGQAVEGDEADGASSSGRASSSSSSRTTTRELNPGGVTFNRRAVLYDLPPVTATGPAASDHTAVGRSPLDWAVVLPVADVNAEGKDAKKDGPAFRWMRGGKVEEGVRPWPVPPSSKPDMRRPPRPEPVRGVEVPCATGSSSGLRYETQDDHGDDGADEGDMGWVIVEKPRPRPVKLATQPMKLVTQPMKPVTQPMKPATLAKEEEEEAPKSRQATRTATRSESGVPVVTLWAGVEGEEVLGCGENCKW